MHKRLRERQRRWWSAVVLVGGLTTLPVSLSLLALTAYIRFVVDDELELVQGLDTATLPYFLALTGTVNFLSNLLLLSTMSRAHWPSLREAASIRALQVAVFIHLAATILVFSACIVCFVQMALLADRLAAGLRAAMQQYRSVPHVKVRLDLLQMEYGCCGDSGYSDWFTVAWVPEDILVVQPAELQASLGKGTEYTNDDVPFSCCDPASPRPCIHHHVATDSLHHSYHHRVNTTLHSAGCRHALSRYFGHTLLQSAALSLLALTLLQLSIVIMSRLLQTSMQNALDQDDVTASAVGYLFTPPKGPDVKVDVEKGGGQENRTLLPPGADKPSDTTDTEGETTTEDPGSGVSYPLSTDLDTSLGPEEEALYENIPPDGLYDDLGGWETTGQRALPLFPSEMAPSQGGDVNVNSGGLSLGGDVSVTSRGPCEGGNITVNSGGPCEGGNIIVNSGGPCEGGNIIVNSGGARHRGGSKAFGSLGITPPHPPSPRPLYRLPPPARHVKPFAH